MIDKRVNLLSELYQYVVDSHQHAKKTKHAQLAEAVKFECGVTFPWKVDNSRNIRFFPGLHYTYGSLVIEPLSPDAFAAAVSSSSVTVVHDKKVYWFGL
jgi:hypothetical protein